MFKFWQITDEKSGSTTVNYQGSFESDLNTYMDKKIGRILKEEISEKLANAWIEKYGAELIDQISPEEVTKSIKTLIAQRVLK